MTEKGADAMRDTAAELTPRGETGEAAESWHRLDVKRRTLGRGEVEVSADVVSRDPVVKWLNDGTKSHEVKPSRKQALRLPQGERASAHVRGIRPHHMIENAATATEVRLGELSEPVLERWKQRVEDVAKQKPGVE